MVLSLGNTIALAHTRRSCGSCRARMDSNSRCFLLVLCNCTHNNVLHSHARHRTRASDQIPVGTSPEPASLQSFPRRRALRFWRETWRWWTWWVDRHRLLNKPDEAIVGHRWSQLQKTRQLLLPTLDQTRSSHGNDQTQSHQTACCEDRHQRATTAEPTTFSSAIQREI